MSNLKPNCEIYIGIDVSKKNLDVYILEHDKHFQFSQTEKGVSELVETIKSFNTALVVIEATGGFESNAASILASSNIPVASVSRSPECTSRVPNGFACQTLPPPAFY
ncbi:MAG: transposase [Elusimicrobiota bacterium]|nr:transposase [Elusimicrobiota bacterium]